MFVAPAVRWGIRSFVTDKKRAMLSVSVWRGTAEQGEFKEYQVPGQDNQTVLDVVSWIQQQVDPTLSYRFACRVGMCGSCAMTVNGEPRWTCRTHVQKVQKDKRLQVAPLRNFPVVKDLVADLDPFFNKWVEAKAKHHPTATRNDPIPRVDPQSAARQSADEAIECINCAVCYSACDTVTANADYLGPAALQRAWTLVNDVKNADKQHILDAVSVSGGCQNCHSHGSCTRYCPVELNPMKSVAGLKKASVVAWWRKK